MAAFACCGELQADQLMQETAESLAKTLRTVTRVHEASGTPAEVFLLSAPDPDEETRAMVRRVAADLESGVPLWRMALLYTDEETYGPLAREELDAAGVPWHSALGRPASAGWAARSLLGLLGNAYAAAGKKAEAIKIRDELEALSKQRYVSDYSFALVNLGVGDKEEALRRLQRSYGDRAGDSLRFIRVDPLLDPIRRDPRFEALAEKIIPAREFGNSVVRK